MYRKIIKILKANGYEGYLVGGAVRDIILNRECHDYDVTTNALPNEVKDIFKDYKVIETGIKHGTVTILIDNEPIEVTTYRTDLDYVDHRHPTKVEFSRNLSDDVNRRDFTINAICLDDEGNIVDLVDGVKDIKNKIIRTVNNPDDRFEEDALRILRALRFSSTLSFEIEEETRKSILRKYHLLDYVSKERIYQEFNKMVVGKNFTKIFREYFEVFAFIFDDFKKLKIAQNNPYHIYDVFEHTMHAVDAIETDYILKLTMLFHDIGKMEAHTTKDGIDHFYNHAKYSKDICEKFLDMLKYSKKEKHKILNLIYYHDYRYPLSEYKFRKFLSKIDLDLLEGIKKVKLADDLAKNKDYVKANIEYNQKRYLDGVNYLKSYPLTIKDIKVNGSDLLKEGIKPKDIGEALEYLSDLVLQDIKYNDYDILIRKAKNKFKK